VVIDLDRKNGIDGLESLRMLGEVPETLTAETGSGGLHLYFKHPGLPIKNSAGVLGPGIDVRGDGGYVVLPPSPHRSGGRYRWLAEVPIADLPPWLLQALRAPPRARRVTRELLERLAGQWRRSKSIDKQDLGAALDAVTKGEAFAAPGERDTTLYRLSQELSRTLPDADPGAIAKLFEPSLDRMAEDAPDAPTTEDVAEKLGRAYTESDAGAWSARMASADNGVPKACLGNVIIVLESHPVWAGVLAYDERRGREVFVKPPPWGGAQGPIEDVDAARLATWLTERQRLAVGADVCRIALDTVARTVRIDGVRDELLRLVWDGIPRLDRWLVDYAGAEDTPYVRAVGAKFAISMVARALDPGCKVDTTLILEGAQGIGKSTLLRALASSAHFADDLPDLSNKDARDYLRGPWLIEVKELQAFDRKETNAIKAFVDQRVDRFRPAYGAKTIEVPRRCVFAGTTNAETYLRDTTGNRRYWPVATAWCDPVGLAVTRGALLAEAVARYRAGEPWWLDEAQEGAAEREQEARQEEDSWEDAIVTALAEGQKKRFAMGDPNAWAIEPGVQQVTVGEVLEHVLGIPAGQRNRAHEMRVAAVLKKMGWQRREFSKGCGRRWRYVRG
jgi:predicted P-loop ATPase